MEDAPLYGNFDAIFGDRLSKSLNNPLDYYDLASEGVNAEVIDNFRHYFGLSVGDTSQMLGVSEPTMYRWTQSKKALERNASIKLFEMAQLFLYGERLFNDKDTFFKWLKMPNTALGGLVPKKLVEVPEGISKIHQLLGRIEYGVYS